ncbi:MAG: hypothetical protein CH6_1831 [Candidatus Kapaibacterium sp.]|nr:MAG: hypothetical protein CH6_1831 [Candidatus Kapabacteria bacterium]
MNFLFFPECLVYNLLYYDFQSAMHFLKWGGIWKKLFINF